MATALHYLQTIGAFALVLGILVFVHELGHYLAGRWRGIRVETFSIGFGRSLAEWRDSRGTVWRLSALPLGGYVKFAGMALDPREQEATDAAVIARGEAYFQKSVVSRAIVAAAGPAANFALAIVLFTALFSTVGREVPLPVVGEVVAGSAAAEAGLKTGDVITEVDGEHVTTFEQLRDIVLASPDLTRRITFVRDGKTATLQVHVRAESEGGAAVGRLGMRSGKSGTFRLDPASAFLAGIGQTWDIIHQSLSGLAQIVTTGRGADQLGGPIKIAQMSGQVVRMGISSLTVFIAFLSVSLGLVNLFPIPILDGGHLLFYAAEAVRGRPLPARAQEYGYRVGFALIAMLFVAISIHDVAGTALYHWVRNLIG